VNCSAERLSNPDDPTLIRRLRAKAGVIRRGSQRLFEKALALISPRLLLTIFPPRSVGIEPTNICNLHCPLCPTPMSTRQKGRMSLENFSRLVGDLPASISMVYLYLSGEPLLHPNCFDMISVLSRRGLRSCISTNGALLGGRIEDVLDSKLSELIISLDGATEATYQKYRVGGDFHKLLANIRRLVQARRERNLLNPKIVLQCIVMRSTEPELDLMVQLAKELEVDALSLISVSLGTHRTDEWERSRLADSFLPQTSSISRYERDAAGQWTTKWRHRYCAAWRQPVILWNGDMTVCCFDHNGLEVYGNVLASKFSDVWLGTDHAECLKKILFRKMTICRTCGITSGDENRLLEVDALKRFNLHIRPMGS
jgi:MoaA/NifB/PqqE/SkfB family radical SAM enzyme